MAQLSDYELVTRASSWLRSLKDPDPEIEDIDRDLAVDVKEPVRFKEKGYDNGRPICVWIKSDPPIASLFNQHGQAYVWTFLDTLDERRSLTPEERRQAEITRKKKRDAAAAAREADYEKAAKKAQATLNAAKDAPADHPYFVRKQVSPCKGLKLGQAWRPKQTLADGSTIAGHMEEAVLMPLQDLNGYVWSYQAVFADGFKAHMPGGKARGSFFIVPAEDGCEDSPLVFLEGLATGLTVHELTGTQCVVCCDCGNILPVASEFVSHGMLGKVEYGEDGLPTGRPKGVLFGDNDHATKKPDGAPWNPGLEAVMEASRILNLQWNVPPLEGMMNKEGTKALSDYNDMAALRGPEATLEALSILNPPELPGFKPESQQAEPQTQTGETDSLPNMPAWMDEIPTEDKLEDRSSPADFGDVGHVFKSGDLAVAMQPNCPAQPEDEESPATVPVAPEPPSDIFPEDIEAMISDVAEVFAQGHRGLAFAATFALLGHGTNGYLAVSFKKDKPVAGNAFILLICNSSASKTDTFNTLFSVYDKEDSDVIMQNRRNYEEYMRQLAEWNKLGQAEQKKTAKPLRPPRVPSDMYDDMTDAALFQALEENIRHDGVSCITIRGDEALHVLSKLDAYKARGVGGSLDDIIKMWNGGKIKKKRLTSQTVEVPRAYLNLSANTQPYAFQKMFNAESLMSGLLGRFMFFRADIDEDLKWTDAEISSQSKETIAVLTSYLKRLKNRGAEPQLGEGCMSLEREPTTHIIGIAPEARRRFSNWYDTTAKSFGLDGESRKMLMNKVSMNLSKISLHLHVARCCFGLETNEEIISLETVEKAIKAMEYIIECEKHLWDVVEGKKFTERVSQATIRMAEAIVEHSGEIDRKTFKVPNKTLVEWAVDAGIADKISVGQYRNLVKPLKLRTASGHHGGRGRIIDDTDLRRLVGMIAEAKASKRGKT